MEVFYAKQKRTEHYSPNQVAVAGTFVLILRDDEQWFVHPLIDTAGDGTLLVNDALYLLDLTSGATYWMQ